MDTAYLALPKGYTSYNCQLSRIMCEPHACGSKKSISHTDDNFSHLTHKSGQLVSERAKMSHFSLPSEKASNSFGSVQKSSKHLRTFSLAFGSLQEIIGNLWKSPERFWKSRSWGDESLKHLTQKKLAGITSQNSEKLEPCINVGLNVDDSIKAFFSDSLRPSISMGYCTVWIEYSINCLKEIIW